MIGGACFILFILGLGIFVYRQKARSSKNGYDQYKEDNKLIDIEKSGEMLVCNQMSPKGECLHLYMCIYVFVSCHFLRTYRKYF